MGLTSWLKNNWRHQDAPVTVQTAAVEPEATKTALTPDGYPIVQFSPDITNVLRFEGIGYNYAQIYATQQNVRTVIDYIARNAAGLSCKMYEKVARGPGYPSDRIELNSHPLALLLDDPTPGESRYDFYYAAFADFCIYDENKYLLIRPKPGAPPEALVRVPPPNLVPKRDALSGRVTGWQALTGEPVPFEDVLWFTGYDPNTSQSAISPMETLRRLLAEEYARDRAQEAFWRRGLRKDGVIERDKDAPKISDEGRESFLIDAEDAMAGTNGYRPFMLEPGMKWIDVTWKPNDTAYIQARRISRQEACAMWHVPPSLVSAAENGGQPDEASLEVFHQSSLPPYLERFEANVKAKLIPMFTPSTTIRRQQYVKFNLDEKLRGSFEKKAAIMATVVGGPVATVNEGRARLDLPKTDNPADDEIYAPMNSMRGGGTQASPQNPVATPARGIQPAGTTPTPTPSTLSLSDEIEQWEAQKKDAESHKLFVTEKRARYEERHARLLEKFFDRQRNAVKGGKDVNTERWNRELSNDLYGVALQTVEVFGEEAASQIKGTWSTNRVQNFLKVNSRSFAEGINTETAGRLDAEDADPDAIFNPDRASSLAMSRTTFLMNWAVMEAAHQNGAV